MDNKMRIMSEEFENTNTGEKVTPQAIQSSPITYAIIINV